MSSRGKKKTTMAKLNREVRLRERRDQKQARKEARKVAAALPPHEISALDDPDGGLRPVGADDHEGELP